METPDIKKSLIDWAANTESVRAVVLTSSRSATSDAPTDAFSDYDVALYVNSLSGFQNDQWLQYFGETLVCWPQQPQTTFSEDWLTRLVLFENRTRIDFQIATNTKLPPSDYDWGYEVLLDKDGFTNDFPSPTKTAFLIKKPSQTEFLTQLNDFFWDATYVAKYLWRGDLFYAKSMLETSLRFEYFERMIEWHIASEQDWKVSTNVHGRYFRKYLRPEVWDEIEKTFAGAGLEENWQAFFKMVDMYTTFAKDLAKKLNYPYPHQQEEKMLKYFSDSKKLPK